MADEPTVDQNGNLNGPRRTVGPSDPAMLKAALNAKATPNPATQPTNGSSSSLGGAINDALNTMKSGAPQGLAQRKLKVNQAVNAASGGVPLGDEFK